MPRPNRISAGWSNMFRQVSLGLFLAGGWVTGCGQPARPSPTPTPPAVVEFQIAPTAAPTATLPGPLVGTALLKALQQGGYVIFFRHAATYRSQLDTDQQNLANCATQRNLDETGQAQARAIGLAFSAANIPVGPVRASPYCRTRDTAQLAFGRVELTPDLINPSYTDDAAESAHLEARLAQFLSDPPPIGFNTILVGHNSPSLQTITGLSIVEGEAAIFAPHGRGQFSLIGRLLPEEWTDLAGQMK